MSKAFLRIFAIGATCSAQSALAFAHGPQVPEPVCQTESECLKAISDCAYVGNSQVIFTAKLQAKQVCVAYNGTVSHITTQDVRPSQNFNDFFPATKESIASALKDCRSARREYLKVNDLCSK